MLVKVLVSVEACLEVSDLGGRRDLAGVGVDLGTLGVRSWL